ncbi:MAG: hypothetical protein JWP18_1975, partial [Solirubrobacterales bacterium]|nr:hypothetical protein [Solirubrobacterales bacterium]
METVLLCSRCGTPNDRQDVTCVRCAELLNRELVQQFDAAEQTAIAEAPAAVGRAGLILAAEAGVDVVEPGQSIAFELRIRNESRIVDNYDLRVEGAAKAWATVTPATVYLLPLGSGAESEATVRVVIQPPRDFTSTAGAHWLYVDADSRASGAFAGRAESTFSILPFKAWTTDVAPALALGRLKAHFNVAVHNEGNDELHLVLDARDEAGRVRARFDHPEVVLEPGVIRVLRLVVRPRFPLPVGPRLTHRLGIEALPAPETPPQTEAEEEASAAVKAKQTLLGGVKGAAAGSSASVGKDGLKFAPPKRPKSPKPPKVKMDLATLAKLRASDDRADLAGRIVVYRQRPFVPLWLVVLLLLALVAAYVYVSRLPDKVVVPDLKGVATSFEADKQLRAAGLTLASPIQQKVEADKTPGEVVGQSPEQKESVDRGSSVTIQVAAGVLNHPTPDLLGATREEADRTLRKAKLTLGPVQPVDAPAKWVVARQIPVKALSVPEGTPVMLFLVKPKPTKAELAAAAAAAAAKAKRDAEKKTPALKLATVPPIGALSAADYAKALTMLKLRPVTKPITASLKKDAVVSVLPAPGSQVIVGKPVTIVASAGIPPLAVQSDGVIRLLNPLGGKRLGLIPADG